MKLLIPVAICALLLVGCGPDNYDECVLAEVKDTNGSNQIVRLAEGVCRTRFPYIEGKDADTTWEVDIRDLKEKDIQGGTYTFSANDEFNDLSDRQQNAEIVKWLEGLSAKERARYRED